MPALRNNVGIWQSGLILSNAFLEQQACLQAVYPLLDDIIATPSGTRREFTVRMNRIPRRFYALRHNLFSVLFQSVYHLLGTPAPRRLLYGQLNHLFRIWVTSTDNLLDHEDKVVVPLSMGAGGQVARQVIALMAADRVLVRLLDAAVQGHVITAGQRERLLTESLQVLLPSAVQEAGEEGGIAERPPPDTVLNSVHRTKTGLLFQVPFLGPETEEDAVQSPDLDRLKDALLDFGLGCQILDDIRDVSRDIRDHRHNYVLSQLWTESPERYRALERMRADASVRLYGHVLDVVFPAARLAFLYLRRSLDALAAQGLDMPEAHRERAALLMFSVLDVEDLRHACHSTP